MPLPLSFAITDEQTLIENTSLACKDAPVLWALSSSAYYVQGEFYLLVLVCNIWPILSLMTTYLPCTKGDFFFGIILKAITSKVLLCENRPRFQHALLLPHFRTVCLQPSDLQRPAWVCPVACLDLKMTRAQTHFLIQELQNFDIQGGTAVKWLLSLHLRGGGLVFILLWSAPKASPLLSAIRQTLCSLVPVCRHNTGGFLAKSYSESFWNKALMIYGCQS